jgi:hypothetical protein
MVSYMKNYVAERGRWIDSQLLAGYRPPAAPAIVAPPSPEFSAAALPFKLRSMPSAPNAKCQWRLAEVTDPTSRTFDPDKPWKYEIEAIWRGEISAAAPANVPTKDLRPAHTYRVRARWQDEKESWSRWSAPVQFTVPGP